jgi:hypothetical protein
MMIVGDGEAVTGVGGGVSQVDKRGKTEEVAG